MTTPTFTNTRKVPTRKNGKITRSYNAWKDMRTRCYNTKFHERNPTYIGCSMAEVWWDFSNFYDWFSDNYIEGWALDKDLKNSGNKEYSPETCMYIPRQINNLLLNRAAGRGIYPQGVSWFKRISKFRADCNFNDKQNTLGYYDTPEEAQAVYWAYKEGAVDATLEQHPLTPNVKEYVRQAFRAQRDEALNG